jgi:hypothetical protein
VGPKFSLALTPEAWVMSCLSWLSASGVILLSSYVCLIKQITKCDKPKLSAQRTAGIRCVHRHLVSNITFRYQAVVFALGHRLATVTFPAFCLPSFSAGVHSSTTNDTNLPCKHRVRLCASYHSISWFSNAMQTEKTADMLKLSH